MTRRLMVVTVKLVVNDYERVAADVREVVEQAHRPHIRRHGAETY